MNKKQRIEKLENKIKEIYKKDKKPVKIIILNPKKPDYQDKLKELEEYEKTLDPKGSDIELITIRINNPIEE